MPDLTPARMSYAAALVAAVTFGLYICIAVQTAYHVVVNGRGMMTTGRKVLIAWIMVMLALQTIYFVSGSKWSEIEFVESTQDPGIFASQLSTRLAIIKDTTYTMIIWHADGFLLYRAFLLYQGWYMAVLPPAFLYLASIATGIGLLIETAKPGAAFGQATVIDFGTPFWSTSVAMNVLTTLLICSRFQEAFVPEVVIFLESGCLYAVCAIIYIPMFARNIPLQFPFSALLGSTAGIALHFIIIRMISGKSRALETSLVALQDRRAPRTDDASGTQSAAHEHSIVKSDDKDEQIDV